MDMHKLVAELSAPDAIERISAEFRRKDAERLAAMSPEEREAELKWREERGHAEEELDKATIPLREHWGEMEGLESIIDDLQGQLENLADMALEKLQAKEAELVEVKKLKSEILREKVMQEGELVAAAHRNKLQLEKLQTQEAELKAAQKRIGQLLDMNLQAQDVRRQLDRIEAQGDRIETQTTKTAKDVVETRQGVGVLVQQLPDAKTPPHIEEAEAVAIMKAKGGDMTDRTLRNWLKAGVARRVNLPIKWSDLASVASWSAWVDAYLVAKRSRLTLKSFISEHAGTVEAERARRRSPTA